MAVWPCGPGARLKIFQANRALGIRRVQQILLTFFSKSKVFFVDGMGVLDSGHMARAIFQYLPDVGSERLAEKNGGPE